MMLELLREESDLSEACDEMCGALDDDENDDNNNDEKDDVVGIVMSLINSSLI